MLRNTLVYAIHGYKKYSAGKTRSCYKNPHKIKNSNKKRLPFPNIKRHKRK